jgi:hypothetical protein
VERIVVMGTDEGNEEGFVRLVETLFPECEIWVIPSDSAENRVRVNEPEPESRVTRPDTCAVKRIDY